MPLLSWLESPLRRLQQSHQARLAGNDPAAVPFSTTAPSYLHCWWPVAPRRRPGHHLAAVLLPRHPAGPRGRRGDGEPGEWEPGSRARLTPATDGGWMSTEQIEVLVVGAGQAGVAMSEHLTACGVPHLVVERHRIAERWRSERWDSLVANGPAWHDRFPGLEFAGLAPDCFAAKEQVADYFVAYAEKIGAPIRCGVEVMNVRKNPGRPGFRVDTSDGVINARYVVAATGPFQRPAIPAIVPLSAGLLSIHSSSYRNPRQ